MHRAQSAYTELLTLLNETPDALRLLQEPYTARERLSRPRGFDVFPSNLAHPRMAVYSPRSLKAQEISHLCNWNCTAVLLDCGSQDILIASIYLDITLPVVPGWLEDLLRYVEQHPSGLLLAVDTNAHSTLYGPDQNPRGTNFEDFLFRHGLHVENVGTTPTFQTSVRSSSIDVTLTLDLSTATSNWKVNTRYNGSDHNTAGL